MLKKFRAKGQTVRKTDWIFLFLWTSATAISYAGGGRISFLVIDYVQAEWAFVISLAVMSIAIALAQWLVIRNKILGMGWLWATWIGGTVGGAFSAWASFQIAIIYGDVVDLLVVYGCLRGMTTGIAQWIILRKYSKLADWWILTTTASWCISVLVGSLVMIQLGDFLTLLVGSIYGFLTGIALLLLFWHRDHS